MLFQYERHAHAYNSLLVEPTQFLFVSCGMHSDEQLIEMEEESIKKKTHIERERERAALASK